MDCLHIFPLCLFFINAWIVGKCALLSEYNVVEAILNSASYDNKIHPGAETGQTTVVNLNMYINDISSISEVNMEYTMIVYFRQEWYDRRLISPALKDPVTLSYKHLSMIWVPDVFMPNEKSASFHDITVPNVLLRLQPDGKILYSRRMSMRLICIVNLVSYPFDHQECDAKFESYGYTIDEVELRWRNVDPIQNNTDIKLPEFHLTNISQANCTVSYITGTFSCMKAMLAFKRETTYFITQTFIPSILVVVLSWVSFWIDYRSVPARISLGLLTVLTITTQASGISSRLPRVSYTKAIDVWMSTCLVYVFLALVEYSIVNVIARDVDDKKLEKKVVDKWKPSTKINRKVAPNNDNVDLTPVGGGESEAVVTGGEEGVEARESRCTSHGFQRFIGIPDRYINNKAQFLDVISRVFFPLTFIIFNIAFWVYYP